LTSKDMRASGPGTAMRVLYLVDSLRVGGKERQAVELLKGLRGRKDVQMMVVTMGEEQFYVPDVKALGIPLIFLIRRMRWDPLIFLRLFRILWGFRPHIVHTNNEMATFYALPLTKLLGVKLVNGCIRGVMSTTGFRGKLRKLLLRLSDARVANSKAGLESVGLDLAGKGNHLIYNGFDVDRFRKRAGRTDALGGVALDGRKVVAMVAEFSDFKDYPTYIRAAQILLQKRKDVLFVAVGGGKNLENCRQLAAFAAEAILFLGERRDVESIVSGIDVGVLCTYTEGISNSVMEYMAAGRPTVVTDGGGSRELVVEGRTGFLVPPSDPEAMAIKIEALLDRPDVAEELGLAAQRHLLRQFSLGQLADNTLRMYRSVLGWGEKGETTDFC